MTQLGVKPRRIHVDKGYRGHNHQSCTQVLGLDQRPGTPCDRGHSARMKRRAAVERVIGRMKAEHRIDRNYLKAATATAPRPARCSWLQLQPASALAAAVLLCALIAALTPTLGP
jgi:IS5 family transposase